MWTGEAPQQSFLFELWHSVLKFFSKVFFKPYPYLVFNTIASCLIPTPFFKPSTLLVSTFIYHFYVAFKLKNRYLYRLFPFIFFQHLFHRYHPKVQFQVLFQRNSIQWFSIMIALTKFYWNSFVFVKVKV